MSCLKILREEGSTTRLETIIPVTHSFIQNNKWEAIHLAVEDSEGFLEGLESISRTCLDNKWEVWEEEEDRGDDNSHSPSEVEEAKECVSNSDVNNFYANISVDVV